jgi:hypothetical protein
MERDSLARQIGEKSFTLLLRTREDADFYHLMGRFFGSRATAKALGMPMYDDEHRLWCVIVNGEQRPVACASLEIKPGSAVATMKSAWVEPEERGQRLYDWLFSTRLQIAAEQQQVRKIVSTTTEMSKCTHERYGFRHVSQRGKYSVYWKELER